jgi:hypothetical protein
MAHTLARVAFLAALLAALGPQVDCKAGRAAATTKAPVAGAKAPEKPKNPVTTIVKAKVMGNPLTEQEWLNLVLGQLSPR